MRALHERVDAPIAIVDVHGSVAGRHGHRKSEPRTRPVHEHAVAIPDLRYELRYAFRIRRRVRIEARLATAQQVVDARGVRELLQLQVEQVADLEPGGNVRPGAREQAD